MGRKAEDGAIPHRYHLKETHSSEYSERTEKNILAADATLIIVAEASRLNRILTLDRKGFQTYRRGDGSSFALLP